MLTKETPNILMSYDIIRRIDALLLGGIYLEYPLLPKQMPDRIKTVWRKSNFLTTAIFLLIGIGVAFFLNWVDHLEGIGMGIVIGYFIVVVLIFLSMMALVPYRYQFYRYDITSEDLAFQKGYFFRSITYVPINRIQHVETEQGPFLRKENLMEIVIHTAATSHRIAGLDLEEAMSLRAGIIELVKVAKEDV